eukprot:2080408-Pleurochrysis_carterae.AAC.1
MSKKAVKKQKLAASSNKTKSKPSRPAVDDSSDEEGAGNGDADCGAPNPSKDSTCDKDEAPADQAAHSLAADKMEPEILYEGDCRVSLLQSAANLVQANASGTAVVIPASKGFWETTDTHVFGWLGIVGKKKGKGWEVACIDGVSIIPWHILKTCLILPKECMS